MRGKISARTLSYTICVQLEQIRSLIYYLIDQVKSGRPTINWQQKPHWTKKLKTICAATHNLGHHWVWRHKPRSIGICRLYNKTGVEDCESISGEQLYLRKPNSVRRVVFLVCLLLQVSCSLATTFSWTVLPGRWTVIHFKGQIDLLLFHLNQCCLTLLKKDAGSFSTDSFFHMIAQNNNHVFVHYFCALPLYLFAFSELDDEGNVTHKQSFNICSNINY